MGTVVTDGERPRVVLSQCLELSACRYDGARIEAPWVRELAEVVEIVPVCPEVAIGLGTPRPPIVVLGGGDGGLRLVQPSTEIDLTSRMERFAAELLGSVGEVEGFVLKSRSPSCGLGTTKIYDAVGGSPRAERGDGVFAAAVRAWGRGRVVLADEVELQGGAVRDEFLMRVSLLAAWRRSLGGGSSVKAFHAAHLGRLRSLVSMDGLRSLDRLVDGSDVRGTAYGEALAVALTSRFGTD